MSCPKDFSKAYPFGMFNFSSNNFKLFPRLNPATNVLSGPGTQFPEMEPKKFTPLYSNTNYKMSRKEQISFLMRIGGRLR